MSTEIDKRVVEMQFNNKDFERNVQQSLSTIDKLKMALNFDGAKGLDSITKAANKMDLSNVNKQMDTVQVKFTTLQVAGVTMIQELTKSFINFGKNIWSTTFGQIKSGGMARALKIEQAEFKMKALAKNMFDASMEADVLEGKINGLMKQMGTAIDNAVTGTAYGYDAAADVASQLMASGIRDAEKMENYLKGVAGAAAMTGNSFEQIGHVFTTVASNGKLMTMQLRQFSTYGLNLSATLAQQLGKTEAQINDMVTKGQISFEQFAEALSLAYGDAAAKADDTFAGVTTNIKAQLSRLGQRFAVPFIQNAIPFLKEVKAAIKDISKAIAPMAEHFEIAFRHLSEWGTALVANKDFRNIEVLFRGIENIVYDVVLVLHTLYKAFKRVFPESFTKTLYDLSKAFLQFSIDILPTERGLIGLENAFVVLLTPLKALVGIVKILLTIAKPIITVIFNMANAVFELFSFLSPLIDSVLGFTNKANLLEKTLLVISNIFAFLLGLLRSGITILAVLFYQLSQSDTLTKIMNITMTFGETLVNVGKMIMGVLGVALSFLFDKISEIGSKLPSIFDKISNAIINLYGKIASVFESIKGLFNSETSVTTIYKTEERLGAMHTTIQTLERDVVTINEDVSKTGGVLSGVLGILYKVGAVIKERLSSLTAAKLIFGSFGVAAVMFVLSLIKLNDAFTRLTLTIRQVPFLFTRMNQTLKSFNKYLAPSALVLSFAIAIGVLAISLKKISEIPKDDLERSANVMMKFGAALMIFAFIMNKTSSITTDIGKVTTVLNPVGGIILSIALSMLILGKALEIMGNSIDKVSDIDKTLKTLGILMGSLLLSVVVLGTLSPTLNASAFAFTAFAGGILILTKALIMLTNLDKEISKESLTSILSLLVAFGIGISVTAKATLGSALTILSFATSLIIIIGAIALLSSFPYDTIQHGINAATDIFRMFIPLIIAIGVANKMTNSSAVAGFSSINIAGGLAGFVLSLGAFLLLFAAYTHLIKDTVEDGTLTASLVSLFFIMAFITAVVSILIFVQNKAQIGYRKALDATKGVTLISNGISDIAVTLLALAGTVLILGVTIKLLANTFNTEGIGATIGSIVAVLFIFLVLASTMEMICDSARSLSTVSVKPILGMIATIITIMGVLALLTFAAKDDPVAVIAAAGAIFIALSGLALVMNSMQGFQRQARQINTNVSSATDEILALMGVLGLIAFIMVYTTKEVLSNKNINATDFAVVIGILVAGVAGFSLVSASIMKMFNSMTVVDTKKILKLIGMFSILTSSMLIISASMKLLSTIPTGDLANVTSTISTIALIILAAMAMMPEIMRLWNGINGITFMEIGGGIALFALSLIEIAGALAIMSQLVDVEKLVPQAVAMGILLAEVAVIVGVLAKINASGLGTDVTQAGLGVLAAAGAIVAIAAAFALLSKSGAKADDILKYTLAISMLLTVLFIGIGILTAVANACIMAVPVLQAIALVLGSFGIIGAGVGVALIGISEAFKTFANTTTEEVNNVIDSLIAFALRVPEIISTFALMIITSAPAIGLAMTALFSALTLAIASAIANTISTVLDSLNMVLKAVTDWASKDETTQIVHDASYSLGKVFIDGFIQGIFDGINDSELVQEASAKLYEKFDILKPFNDYETNKRIKEYADDLQSHMRKVFKGEATWEEYGDYIIEGLNNGIRKGYWTTAQATEILGEYALDGYADRLEINSPSLEMMRLGNYTIMGVLEGVKNGEYTFWEALSACAEGGVNKFSSIFTDENLLKNSSLFNGSGTIKTHADIVRDADMMVYDDSIGDYIYNWEASGFESREKYIEYMESKIESESFNLFKSLMGIFDLEDTDIDLNMDGMIDNLEDVGGESEEASKKVDKLRDSIAGCLDIFTEFNSTTKLTSKDVFKTFMNQIEGVSDWTNMMTGLAEKGLSIDILEMLESEGPKSYDKVNAIYNMSSNEIAMLNAMYADSFELINNSTESIDKAAQNIEALTLDNLKDNIEETIVSFEKFDDETKVVLTRLQELEDGGNVNLLMRPAIDTEELNKLGYDAGDGFATMFTSTVSNEAGTIAMNFTPIIVDPKTGKYLGTMSPDKFDDYCNDVLEGVRKDDLNLKVGMTFNGDNAIEEASKAAEEIHNLHEQLGEDWGKDGFANFEVTTVTKEFTDGICEGIENGTDDIRNTMSNYGHAALEALRKELKFEEALEGVKEFRDELSKTISGAMNIFEELSDEEEISSEKMLHNMTDQVKRVGRWATYMAQLAGRGMSEGLLEELRELGPAGYAKVESFVKMTDAQLSKANSLYESSSKVGNYGADKIVSSYANAGYNASLGFKEGVDTDAAKDVMIQLATKSLSSLEKALGIESPSKMMMQDGVYAIQGFILGLQDEESYSLLEESLINLSDKSIDILKSDLAGSKIINVSVNCLKGLSSGFKQNIKMVVDTAHYVASKIINAFNETLKIASPSEEFAWAAEMCNLGFAEAMNSDDTAVVATEDKANDIRNILAEKFLNIGDAVGDDGVYEPVIRPVWDMSDIQAGFNTIDNYMSSRSIRLNAVDAVANRNGLSQDTIAITNAIRDISMDQKAIRQELANLRTDTVNLGSRIDGMSVYLDGSALVGQIVNPMDQAMGAKVVRQKRRKG